MARSPRAGVTVAIVGGGIVGLALALALRQREIDCDVYESAPEVHELGVGITLLPHAMRELAALGLQDSVLAAGIENRESAFFNRFGQRIYVEPRGRFAGYDVPEVGIHRGRVHSILHRTAIARLGVGHIRTNHRCVGVEQDGGGVTLHFLDSNSGAALAPVRADVAIACDGVNSTVRRQFLPNESMVFTGINTWRGVTRRRPILDGRTYLRIGSIRTGKIVIYPIADNVDGAGNQLINWTTEIQSDARPQNDWNKPGRLEAFYPIYADWRFDWLDVAALIRDADRIFEYPMVDKDPVDRWTYGLITFAGDAAHPMYPRGSNGSAQGLIDARCLADSLARYPAEPAAALRAYEAERLDPSARVVRANRESPPDIINLKVEELVGDQPFDDLDAFITQAELRALSDRYKRVAGFGVEQPGAVAGST